MNKPQNLYKLEEKVKVLNFVCESVKDNIPYSSYNTARTFLETRAVWIYGFCQDFNITISRFSFCPCMITFSWEDKRCNKLRYALHIDKNQMDLIVISNTNPNEWRSKTLLYEDVFMKKLDIFGMELDKLKGSL